MENPVLAAIEFGKPRALLNKEMGNWEAAEQRYREIFNLSMQAAATFDDLSDLEKMTVIEALVDANYNIAFVHYVNEDYEEAINTLTSETAKLVTMLKGEILLGICLYHVSFANRDVQMSVEAAKHLLVLEKQEARLFEEDIDFMDDNLLGEAYARLAHLYRFGVGVEKSIEKSHLTIERGLKNIEGETRNFLEQENVHYKKTLFGGWEYR